MSSTFGPYAPTEADHVAARLEWAQMHHKTAEEVRHLISAEAADVYRLAQTHSLRRFLNTPGHASEKARELVRDYLVELEHELGLDRSE